jgi:uncharacterized coiled-coil DUF342 family protein
MATTQELARQYAEYLKLNQDNPIVVLELANKINALTYLNSNQPISKADKQAIVDAIESAIIRKEAPGGGIIHLAEDSSELIKLINMLRSRTQ